jgi:hypothetical protein
VTRDTAFLAEQLLPYNATRAETVGDLLWSAFEYRTQTIGTGPHGLMRVQGSDWSDSFCRRVAASVWERWRERCWVWGALAGEMLGVGSAGGRGAGEP